MRIESESKFLTMLVVAVVSMATTACDRPDSDVELVTATEVEGASMPLGHVAVLGDYTIRANVVQSDELPPEMLAQYGIEAGADRGLLNVVILQEGPDGQEVTVAAEVTAQQNNLMGQSRQIEMRAVTTNDATSYIGSFESSPQDFFRFSVTAKPVGSDQAVLIEFENLEVSGDSPGANP